jgi:hypothetical protein
MEVSVKNPLHRDSDASSSTSATSDGAAPVALKAIKSSPLALEVGKGLCRSKIFRAIVIAGAATTLASFFLSNPVGWVASAMLVSALAFKVIMGVSVFGLVLAAQSCMKGDIAFEMTALSRLFRKSNQHKIEIKGWKKPEGAGSLFVGALPNRLRFSKGIKQINAVYALNEDWETKARGLSIPHNSDSWSARGVNFTRVDVKDHTLMTPDQMDAAADAIKAQIESGKNILVHCRAGVGRSMMAAAAYLMKYGRDEQNRPLTLEAICLGLKISRPRSSIFNKLTALDAYDKKLGLTRPRSSQQYVDLLERLRAQEFQGKKKLRLPSNVVRDFLKPHNRQ